MDYSKTVNLPQTDFPMKANLPSREPEMLKKWYNDRIYQRILESRKGADLFILHDGPPYANGHIHIGHALNKILKDMIIKHKTMKGFCAPYVPGWDCHGLPIELNVTRQLGDKARSMERVEIRRGCREYARDFINIQMEEFKRLGVFGDYENPYLTMSADYEADIVEIFGRLFEKNYIFKNKKPIYWCPTCVTALAEAEVEYDSHTSPSVYVKFPVLPASVTVKEITPEKVFVVIWTTTPWTLPANLAVCLHPEYQYSLYRFGDEYYLLAKGLIGAFEAATGKEHAEEFPLSPEQIVALKVMHPFIDRESRVIFGDHVTLDAGTGIVHTAPGHGQEDYMVGLKYGLYIYCPVDDYGRFTKDFSPMEGMKVFDANEKIIELLMNNNSLIHRESIEHSYPHCWRCKKPLIFRATEQWFFGMDRSDLRKLGLRTVDETKWIPSWGETRFRSMVETRPDWCLSRQRSWGVPIPSFRCEKCGKNLMSAESVAFFAKISREKGIDSWYTEDIVNLVPLGTKCSCGCEKFTKEFDILDVWFDSGVSHFAVLDRWEGLRWPADLYLEGSDQHRGWFQSSLWPALALRQQAPFRAVLTHGFVLDAEGKAMSKSLGNVIPPETLIQQFGADILRLWVSSEDYRNDLRIGMDMVNQLADSYRKIRNTFKFILGNLSDFNPSDQVPYEMMSGLDKWILHKLFNLSRATIDSYEKYEFHMVYRRILNFCAVELSSIYFDISKDILYVERRDSVRRRANQTVLFEVYQTLVRLVAPILAFTAEEIWLFMGNDGSIHVERYRDLPSHYDNPVIETLMEKVVDVKKDVLKALETKRRDKEIKGSLETDIRLFIVDPEARNLIREMGEDFVKFLQVTSVDLLDKDEGDLEHFEHSAVSVRKTDGKKCVRCWNFSHSLGTSPAHPELCPRCTEIILSMEND